MDRRSFLKAGAASGTLLALPACTLGGGDQAGALRGPRPTRPMGTADLAPGRAAWQALRRSLDGELLRPGEPGFDEARKLYAPRFDTLIPAAVLRPAGAPDVAEAVRFARRHGLPLRVRSGGHSYVGASSGVGGIQLDLSRLTGTSYDHGSGAVHVGTGTRLGQLHDALDPLGRTVPTGTCATVGTGLTLGGGIGVESRLYGLTCDSLLGLEVVTADGRVRAVGPHRAPDLFWASRGGGGGSFGVVTAMTYRTWPASPMGFFQLDFASADAVAALRGWQRRLAAMPPEAWATVHLDADGDGSVGVRVFGLSLTGDGAGEAAAMVTAVGRDPARTAVFARSHHDGVRLLAGCAAVPDDACALAPHGSLERKSFVAGSDVLARPLRHREAAAVVAVVAAWSAAGHRGSALLDPLDGRVRDVPQAATAFPWRQATAVVQWYAPLVPHPRLGALRAAYGWLRAGHRAVAAASAGGYVNYLEPGRPVASYYGASFARLRRVRGRYDPHGLFDSPYSIPRA